jgi:hypothetical protein
MFSIPKLVRLYLSELHLKTLPVTPTIGPLETRWRHDFAIASSGALRRRPSGTSAARNRSDSRQYPAPLR